MKKSKLPVAGPSTVQEYKPSKADVDRERRYRAKNALDTLQRAADIKKDRDLMKDIKQHVKEQSKVASKL